MANWFVNLKNKCLCMGQAVGWTKEGRTGGEESEVRKWDLKSFPPN